MMINFCGHLVITVKFIISDCFNLFQKLSDKGEDLEMRPGEKDQQGGAYLQIEGKD